MTQKTFKKPNLILPLCIRMEWRNIFWLVEAAQESFALLAAVTFSTEITPTVQKMGQSYNNHNLPKVHLLHIHPQLSNCNPRLALMICGILCRPTRGTHWETKLGKPKLVQFHIGSKQQNIYNDDDLDVESFHCRIFGFSSGCCPISHLLGCLVYSMHFSFHR